MKSKTMTVALLLLCLLLASRAKSQTLTNVARQSMVNVQYTVDSLILTSNADPSSMVDGYTGTYFALQAGQEGTIITIDHRCRVNVSSLMIRTFVGSQNHRLRGFRWLVSADSVSWMLIVDTASVQSAIFDKQISPTTFRYSKIVVTEMDTAPYNPFATMISEIQMLGTYADPAVYAVAIQGSSSRGVRFNDITWASVNLDSGATIRILWRRSGMPDVIIADSARNTGVYAWETSRVPDGTHVVLLQPNVPPPRIDTEGSGYVQKFLNNEVFLTDSLFEFARTVSAPWSYTSLLGDSITLSWRYTPLIPRTHSFNLYHSINGGTGWVKFAVVTDPNATRATLPAPAATTTEDSVFFLVRIVADETELAFMRTATPVILSTHPSGLSTLWRATAATRGRPSDLSSLIAYGPPGNMRIVGAPDWILDDSGTPLPGWTSSGYLIGSPAAGDLDGDGKMEIVSNRVIREDRSGIWTAPWSGSVWEGTQIVDLGKAGKRSVLYSHGNSLDLGGDTLQHQQRIVFGNSGTGALHMSCSDVNGDGQAEIIYAASNRLYVVDLASDPLPGYPIEFAENLTGWTLLVDFDGTGEHDIVFATATRLYCYHPDGTVRTGFPVIVPCPSYTPTVADLDGDGRSEVVFTSTTKYVVYPEQETFIHAIDGSGQEIQGWPASVFATVYYVSMVDGPYGWLRWSRDVIANIQTPLIASIDGDATPEVLFTSVAGMLYALNADGTMRNGYPVFVGTQNLETGVLGDFDGDGTLNYVIRSDRVDHANAELICLDFGPGSYNPSCIPWPMHLQNPGRTGIAPSPPPHPIISGVEADVPLTFALEQNHPNPFNPTTVIRYQLSVASRADLRVFDVLGREVAVLANGVQQPGRYSVMFDASRLPSGTYFCRLVAGESVAVRRMMLVK